MRWRVGIVEADRVRPWAESASTHPGGLFYATSMLTILSETVKGSSEISPRRDRRAVVGRDSRSGELPQPVEVGK